MPLAFYGAIVALMFLFFGIFLGLGIGERLAPHCVTSRQYWLMHLWVMMAGSFGVFLVALTGFTTPIAGVIGVVGGCIFGLKMGFGESSGPWKLHDRMLRVNRDHLRRSENDQAEKVRRARHDKTPVPELISVAADVDPQPSVAEQATQRASKTKTGSAKNSSSRKLSSKKASAIKDSAKNPRKTALSKKNSSVRVQAKSSDSTK